MHPLVEFHDVSYSIPGLSSPIISHLNLTVQRGETLVLLGESGSGKTTTLKLINRLLLPTHGHVVVDGQSTSDWDPIRLRRQTGYVIQEGGLFPHFTVERNISLVPTLEGWDRAWIEARVTELLELVGLEPGLFAGRYPRELSGGQKQRVGVARALAADPPLLLLDEPFGALDALTRSTLQREFVSLAARLQKTAVCVTHDVREALILGSRIGLMHAGQLLLVESPDQFLQSKETHARAYLESIS